MIDRVQTPKILVAFGLSIVLNCALLASAALYDPHKPASLLSRAADALTTPPGLIVGWLFAPTHSGAGVFLAFACSIAFYTLLGWVFLILLAHLRGVGRKIHFGRPSK